MKNLKKVLALVVVFTMMLSTVAFAAYPDVAADADYATAVEVLSALKILQGDDQGNFNPDANITRAEFAAVVCRALGLEDSANGAKGATAFEDVAASHWATGYINLANQMGIINGMGDGTFAPEANVTFEQAVKMLTCALGYEYMAQTKGGWPTGYLVVANTYGVTAGVKATAGEPASRSVVAELTYNALDCPIMEQGTYGTEEYWYVYDGITHSPKKTLLSEKLDVAKLTGVVMANNRVGFTVPVTDEGMFTFEVKEDVETKFVQDFAQYGQYTWNIKDSKADMFIGQKVDAYITEVSRNTWDALVLVPEEGKNIVTTFASSDIDTNKTSGYALYYEEEGKTASTKLEIAAGTSVVVNNVYQDGTNFFDAPTNTIVNNASGLAAALNNKLVTGRVKAIDWENDYTYDVVIIDTYKHAIVESVNATSGMIRTENYGNINTYPGNDNYIVTITDVEGNAYDIADIAEGDVLALISDNPANPKAYTKVLDIIVIPNADATVTGTVTESDIRFLPSPAPANTLNTTSKVYVDGEAYGLSAIDGWANIFNKDKIASNSVGTFYLTLDGKIIGFEGDKAASGDYAFILESGITSGGIGNGTLQMKVLTAEGEIVTYDVASNVTIPVAGNANKSFDTTSNVNTDTVASSDFALSAWAGKTGELAGYIDPQNPANNRTGILDSFTIAGIAGNEDERFVKINVTSAGKINRIEVPGLTETFTDDTVGATGNLKEYKANSNMWDSSILADNAVVFVLDADDDYTASKVMTVDEAFINENEYAGFVYDDVNGYKEAAMITYKGSKISAEEGFAVVTGVTNITTDNNEKAKKVRFYQNGTDEEKSVTIVNGEAKDLEAGSVVNTDALVLNPGDVFVYSADASGDVDAFAIVAKLDTTNGKTYNVQNYAKTLVATTSNTDCYIEDVEYVYGYIDEITGGDKLSIVGGKTKDTGWVTGTYSIFVGDEANQYCFKQINSDKYSLKAGAWWDGYVDKDDNSEYSYVLVKMFEGAVIDIISIDAETRTSVVEND